MGVSGGPAIVEDQALILDASSDRSWVAGSSTWYDLSGNGNHATVYNSPATQNANTAKQNIYFNGTDEYAQVTANETSLSFKNGQTIGILFYHTFTSGRKNPWDQAYGGYGTITHESGGYFNYYYGGNGGNANPYTSRSSSTTTRSQWQYWVISRDTNNVKWYKNGKVFNSSTDAYTPMSNTTTNNIRIGRGYAGYWVGNMVFVHAYTRGLSASEIRNNYHSLKNRYA